MNNILRRICAFSFALVIAAFALRTDLKGYATVGHTWGTNQVLYYVNPSNLYVSNSAAISAFQTAASAWTSQTPANIQLVYAGTTNDSSLTLNHTNEVFFRNDSSGYIAETYWWYDATGHLVDFDTVLHENYVYFTGSGCTNGIYIEDVAIHEFGHALGLAHSSVPGATMEPSMPSNCDRTQLSLESDDISGIESLYPPTSSNRNTAPTVSISSPGNGASYANGTAVAFNASATDQQDGNITSYITWTSSIDGNIGNGGSFSRTLSAGSHVITASIRDTGGMTSSAQVTVSVAAQTSQAISPDGTTVPTTASQIVDNTGAVWTIGASSAILRNGVVAGGGYGTKILWQGGVIYVYGTDANWYQWTGGGWTKTSSTGTTGGTSTTVSPDGTTVPTTASQIVDSSGSVWTIGSSNAILRNGSLSGGYGTKILWQGGVIYVYGTDANWYQWTGGGWTKTSSTGTTGGTSTTVSPDGTTVPTTASQIVDGSGSVWTIGANSAILRNGTQLAGGYGTKILFQSNQIYVYGTDGNWYVWSGSSWSRTTVGGTNTSTASPDGTMVPTMASQIVDNSGSVWTIGGSYAILRNGVALGGVGTKIYWKSGTIYVYGTDYNWWRWSGSSWSNIGTTQP